VCVTVERRWKILLLVSVGSFMSFLDAPIVSIAFPSIAKSFRDSSPSTLAWVLDAYFLGFAVLLVLAGKLADRYGRRRLFLGGIALFTASSIVCGAAPSIGILIAARVGQAIGAATVVPAGQGLMLAAFPAEQRKTAIGALAAIIGFATAMSPAIGGGLIHIASWRWIFYVNIVLGVGAILWGSRLLDRDEPKEAHAALPDFLGAALQAAAVGFVVLALLKRSEWGWGDAKTIGAFCLAAVLLPLFVWRSSRAKSPVVDLSLFRNHGFSVANLGSFWFAVGFYLVTFNSVLFMTSIWHYSVLQVGLAFTPGAVIGTIVGGPAGALSEKYGPRGVAFVGTLASAAGMLLIVLSTRAHADYVGEWLPGSLLFGAGSVAALTALFGAAMASVPERQFALGTGINSAIRQVGGALGVALVFAIVGIPTFTNALQLRHHAWDAAVAAFFLAAMSSMLLPRKSLAEAPAALAGADITLEPEAATERGLIG
jgi:EmrB/QacA subfamily drug resistance transporter